MHNFAGYNKLCIMESAQRGIHYLHPNLHRKSTFSVVTNDVMYVVKVQMQIQPLFHKLCITHLGDSHLI